MSGVHMEFNITDTGVKQLFSRMSHVDFLALNQEMGQALVDETIERFNSSQAPDGSSWEVSARAWEQGGKTLVDSATLLSGIHYQADTDGFVIGSPEIYAAAHHFGIDEVITVNVKPHTRLIHHAFGRPLPFGVYQNIKAHSREQHMHLPARPIFGLETKQEDILEDIWLDWLDTETLND